MLTKLRIQNFKSLADTGELAIRPLTFLVGPNSAGKSSLLQALLLLRQTVDERDPTITLKFNGPWIRLGSYLDCVHRETGEKLGNRKLKIDLTFLEPHFDFYQDRWDILYKKTSINFKVKFGYDGEVFLQQASYRSDTEELTIEQVGPQRYRANGEASVQPRKFYDYSQPPSSRHLGKGEESSPAKPENNERSINSFDLDPWEAAATAESDLIGFFRLAIEFFFSQLFYLGPLRQRPEPTYQASGETPQDVGLAGERAVDVLIANIKKGVDEPLAQVRHWLNTFDIASDVELIAHTPTLYEFRLTDKQTGVVVNHSHVGFGASQVIPIIVEGFYAPDHAVLLVEQPEIHLHPRAQARLADLLVAISQEAKTLIVETHSEHLLSQIQVRMAQGDISRDDVAIYYFEPTSAGTRVVPIEINELGQFGNWPAGFFDEGLKLADAHLQAIAKAQGHGNGRD